MGRNWTRWQFTDAGEACPPPTTEHTATTLDIAAMGPVCLEDAPYIEVTFGDQPQFDGRTATVTFVDLDGNVVGTETAAYEAGATVRFVYPGATVDAAGNARGLAGSDGRRDRVGARSVRRPSPRRPDGRRRGQPDRDRIGDVSGRHGGLRRSGDRPADADRPGRPPGRAARDEVATGIHRP